LRWQRCAHAASDKLKGIPAVHVMDREADIYELMSALTKEGVGFIIRSGQNRLVEGGKLFEQMDWAPMQFRREVKLSARSGKRPPESRRSHPAREGRSADLVVSACRMSVQKPTSAVDLGLPNAIEINVVRVLEVSPPPGEEPVEWRLFTTEPIETQVQIEEIVDAYRARWVIEEYFKALKTGCNYERSQLESFDTLESFLGICAPVAWQLLLLRSTARDTPDDPASRVLTGDQIKVLHLIARKPLPPAPSVAHVMAAIAVLGAHIKSNGPPGWQVLGRGFEELLRAVDLHDRMISRGSCDQS
jgi:hypothetical protein